MAKATDPNNAADNLAGLLLNERWMVLEKVDLKPGGTGGNYSVRYIVEDTNDGSQAFLKALDYKAFFTKAKGKDPVKVVTDQNSAFEYERDVLLRCKGKNLSNIIRLHDTGTVTLEEFAYPIVPFLIFEMAEGDIRSKIDFSNKIDTAWKLKSLHNVAVGLKQLHGAGIGHQDLKPSNVLLYENSLVSKIGDLGNSLCSEIKAPHNNPMGFEGDADYVPIEFLYRHIEPDFTTRLRSTDMYLFGSLISFYFSGVNMTTLIFRNINKQFRWNNWSGSYTTVRPYLMDGYYKAIKDVKKEIQEPSLAEEIGKLIEYLCYPFPSERGHPVSKRENGNQYEFHRTITKLDILFRKMELEILGYATKL